MKVELRYPHIDRNAPPHVQVEQMRTYLFTLVEQLQVVISNLPENEAQKNELQEDKING
jgi:hypothetical protein